MARHKQQSAPALDDPALDISSLIDVCFLLLIYFIVTSTISPREQDLTIGPPGRTPPEVTEMNLQTLYIHVAANGTVSSGLAEEQQVLDIDPAVRELPLLQAELRLFKSGIDASGDKPLVQIDAEAEASHQRVIDVLNALAAEGIEAVALTDRSDE